MLAAMDPDQTKADDQDNGYRSNLTVGIAAYNEAGNIGNLIQTIQLETQEDDQIIIVSSGSTDKTPDIVMRYCESDPRVRLLVEESRSGKATAINRILTEYEGEMLLLVSADVLPQSGCIGTMMSVMRSDRRIGMVSSRPSPVNGTHNLIGYLAHLYWRLHHEALSVLDENGENTQGGEAILVRRGIVSSIPVDCINDDAYIGVETVKKGYRVKYCPQARVRTKAPTTIPELIGQRRRIVAGHMKVKKQTGIYPRVLTTMSFQHPSKFTMIVGHELSSNPKSLLKFMVAVYVEGVSALLATIDKLFGRNNYLWRPAASTKILDR